MVLLQADQVHCSDTYMRRPGAPKLACRLYSLHFLTVVGACQGKSSGSDRTQWILKFGSYTVDALRE